MIRSDDVRCTRTFFAKTCDVDRYDALTGKWQTLDVTQNTFCYSDHSGVADDDGTIYLFGGYTEDYQAQSTVVKVEISEDDELTFSALEATMSVVSIFALEFARHWHG